MKTEITFPAALQKVMDKLNQTYGAGSVKAMGEVVPIETISSGSLAIDVALGVGGYPKGRIVEIYGPESSGKTTLAMHAMLQAQKAGGICAIIDVEHAFDTTYAEALGIDVPRLIISQPDYGEQALEIADQLIRSGEIALIVIDSVAALVPKSELEGEMGDSKLGLHARLMSQALRKMTAIIHNSGAVVIFINQLREKIGVMFGSPEVTTGGNALKYYASVRIDIRKIGASTGVSKDAAGEATGNRSKIKVVKNKVGSPFKICEIDIIFGKGIDTIAEILDISVELDLINKKGSHYYYNDTRIGQGKEAALTMLRDNEDLAADLEAKIREICFSEE
jgi:recombination protein RecA